MAVAGAAAAPEQPTPQITTAKIRPNTAEDIIVA